MIVWEVVFYCVVLFLCLMYVAHCYVGTGDTISSTLANRVETAYPRARALPDLGTLHAFSYVISNARAVAQGRRRQSLDLFAQLAKGVRNFQVDLYASDAREAMGSDKRVRRSFVTVEPRTGGDASTGASVGASSTALPVLAAVAFTIKANDMRTNLYILDALDELYVLLKSTDKRGSSNQNKFDQNRRLLERGTIHSRTDSRTDFRTDSRTDETRATVWVRDVEVSPHLACRIDPRDAILALRSYVVLSGYERNVEVASFDKSSPITWVEFLR